MSNEDFKTGLVAEYEERLKGLQAQLDQLQDGVEAQVRSLEVKLEQAQNEGARQIGQHQGAIGEIQSMLKRLKAEPADPEPGPIGAEAEATGGLNGKPEIRSKVKASK